MKCEVIIRVVRGDTVLDEDVVYECNREDEAIGFKNLIIMGRSYYSEMSRIADLLYPDGNMDHEWDAGLLDEIAEIVQECKIPARYFKSRWTGDDK